MGRKEKNEDLFPLFLVFVVIVFLVNHSVPFSIGTFDF